MSDKLAGFFLDPWGRTVSDDAFSPLVDNGNVLTQSNYDLSDVYSRTPLGDPKRAITETMWGLNHRSLNNSIPINKDYFGLTFFTRPDLRLAEVNLKRDPRLAGMLDSNGMTTQRMLRALLDMRHNEQNNFSYPSGLTDPKQIFMPVLTNQLVSMSGWQDVSLPTYTSEAGVYGEMYSFADGIADIFQTYDITANFRNITGDPITYLFYYWVLYAAGVYKGDLVPYQENIRANRVDYQTRIYRLILDHTKRYVQKIAYCGAAFPIGVPMGTHFNFESDTPINRANDQISITFRAIGAEYMNDRVVYAFNKAVCMGNNDMYPNFRVSRGMMKIPYEYIYLFNFQGYPYINIRTHELEWYVYREQFQAIAGAGAISDMQIDTVGVDAGDLGYTPGFNLQ